MSLVLFTETFKRLLFTSILALKFSIFFWLPRSMRWCFSIRVEFIEEISGFRPQFTMILRVNQHFYWIRNWLCIWNRHWHFNRIGNSLMIYYGLIFQNDARKTSDFSQLKFFTHSPDHQIILTAMVVEVGMEQRRFFCSASVAWVEPFFSKVSFVDVSKFEQVQNSEWKRWGSQIRSSEWQET